MRRQRLDGFRAVSSALDHAQISVGKYLEAIREDGRATVARIADLCGGARYGQQLRWSGDTDRVSGRT